MVESAAAARTMTFYRHGRWLRAFVAFVFGFIALTFVVNTLWGLRTATLECIRAPGVVPVCEVRHEYLLGFAARDPLPLFDAVRVEARSVTRRGAGSSSNYVLMLGTYDGTRREIGAFGSDRARAHLVASQVNDYLRDSPLGMRAWRLRESERPLLSFVVVFTIVGALVFGLTFATTRISFDPPTRTVRLARSRWPLRSSIWSAPIDRIDGAERIRALRSDRARYSVQLRVRDAEGHGDLSLRDASLAHADGVAATIDEWLAAWRRV